MGHASGKVAQQTNHARWCGSADILNGSPFRSRFFPSAATRRHARIRGNARREHRFSAAQFPTTASAKGDCRRFTRPPPHAGSMTLQLTATANRQYGWANCTCRQAVFPQDRRSTQCRSPVSGAFLNHDMLSGCSPMAEDCAWRSAAYPSSRHPYQSAEADRLARPFSPLPGLAHCRSGATSA